ncbi:translation initiation factor eIF-1A, partial [Anncaliia algerae PRA109]
MAQRKSKGKRSMVERSIEFADEIDSFYGIIQKEYGGCSFLVYCSDKIERRCTLRGKLQKKVWIGVSDIVYVTKKEDNDRQGYIEFKYTQDEIKVLKEHNFLKVFEEEESKQQADIDFEEV